MFKLVTCVRFRWIFCFLKKIFMSSGDWAQELPTAVLDLRIVIMSKFPELVDLK